MANTPGSGSGARKGLEVQVLSWALRISRTKRRPPRRRFQYAPGDEPSFATKMLRTACQASRYTTQRVAHLHDWVGLGTFRLASPQLFNSLDPYSAGGNRAV